MKACQDIADLLLEASFDAAAATLAELSAHIAACPACAQVSARLGRLVQALREQPRRAAPAELEARVLDERARRSTARAVGSLGLLERPSAPDELTGRVVSAMHAGHRQERATGWIAGLSRRSAPAKIAERLRGLRPAPGSAPVVLDRLVAEELADAPKALTSRFLRRLGREPAPEALGQRLTRDVRHVGERRGALGRRLVAAGLLIAFALGWGAWSRLDDPELSFHVQRASSIDDLSPAARALLAELAGVGALDAALDGTAPLGEPR